MNMNRVRQESFFHIVNTPAAGHYTFSWPQNLMGSIIYSKQEWIEILLSISIWGTSTLEMFEEGVLEKKNHIMALETKLNSLLSYLKRLQIPIEQDKIYSARVRKYKKMVKRFKIENINIKANAKICEELYEICPEMENPWISDFTSLENLSNPAPLLEKSEWIKYEKSRIKDDIDYTKDSLKRSKTYLSEKISLYNRLKRKIEKKCYL
jgi:hypothetical protein